MRKTKIAWFELDSGLLGVFSDRPAGSVLHAGYSGEEFEILTLLICGTV